MCLRWFVVLWLVSCATLASHQQHQQQQEHQQQHHHQQQQQQQQEHQEQHHHQPQQLSPRRRHQRHELDRPHQWATRPFRSLVEGAAVAAGAAGAPHAGDIPWPVKREAVVEGDLILGGLMMVHEREESVTCGPVMPQGGVQALEAMLFTLDVLNAEPALIPNVTLGAHILDDCDKDTYGLEMAVDFIKAHRRGASQTLAKRTAGIIATYIPSSIQDTAQPVTLLVFAAPYARCKHCTAESRNSIGNGFKQELAVWLLPEALGVFRGRSGRVPNAVFGSGGVRWWSVHAAGRVGGVVVVRLGGGRVASSASPGVPGCTRVDASRASGVGWALVGVAGAEAGSTKGWSLAAEAGVSCGSVAGVLVGAAGVEASSTVGVSVVAEAGVEGGSGVCVEGTEASGERGEAASLDGDATSLDDRSRSSFSRSSSRSFAFCVPADKMRTRINTLYQLSDVLVGGKCEAGSALPSVFALAGGAPLAVATGTRASSGSGSGKGPGKGSGAGSGRGGVTGGGAGVVEEEDADKRIYEQGNLLCVDVGGAVVGREGDVAQQRVGVPQGSARRRGGHVRGRAAGGAGRAAQAELGQAARGHSGRAHGGGGHVAQAEARATAHGPGAEKARAGREHARAQGYVATGLERKKKPNNDRTGVASAPRSGPIARRAGAAATSAATSAAVSAHATLACDSLARAYSAAAERTGGSASTRRGNSSGRRHEHDGPQRHDVHGSGAEGSPVAAAAWAPEGTEYLKLNSKCQLKKCDGNTLHLMQLENN
ncbi:LOW QUALITY PROTEIN: Metabotropic glutamate receptor 2 [Gryllus bimaculatus]|nr:LOW QUALITY PROTEIN: Metabotropic glutamate receptor 2 [Gryllus bimaculatus]